MSYCCYCEQNERVSISEEEYERYTQLEADLAAAKSRIQSLEEIAERYGSQRDALTIDLAAARQEIERLTNRVDELCQAHEGIWIERDKLRVENERLRQSLARHKKRGRRFHGDNTLG